MAWIPSYQELRTHPKTRRLARLLNIPAPQAIGHLHLLWWWAMDYAQDGDLEKYDAGDLADAAGWEGDATAFLEALATAGFVDVYPDLDLDDSPKALHDWDQYGGRFLAQKQFLAERQTRKRQLYDDTELTREVRARDGDSCRYCGKVVDWKDRRGTKGGTYDHVDPEGGNTASNLVVACRQCNSIKQRRTPEQAGIYLRPAGNLPEPAPKSAIEKSREEERREEKITTPIGVVGDAPASASASAALKEEPVRETPAAKPAPRRKGERRELSEEQRQKLLTDFADVDGVEWKIDRALNHKASEKWLDVYRGVQDWLRDDRARQSAGGANGTNNGRSLAAVSGAADREADGWSHLETAL